MPDNPQHTLGLPATKYYNDIRSVRIEILAWIRFVNQNGRKTMQEIIKRYQAMTTRYNGSYMHLTGALLHIANKGRWDLEYLAMR